MHFKLNFTYLLCVAISIVSIVELHAKPNNAFSSISGKASADEYFAAGYQYLTQTNDYANAIRSFRKLIQNHAAYQNHIGYFYMGEAYFYGGDYKKAYSYYRQYLSFTSIRKRELALLRSKSCLFAQKAIQWPVAYELIPLDSSINSLQAEYFPALTADNQTIYFTVRVDSTLYNRQEDIYMARNHNGKWKQREKLSNAINTPDKNEGAHTISPDGKYLIFTACNRADGYGDCDIYIAQRQPNGWGNAKNIGPAINSNQWESQPSISTDGKELYFARRSNSGRGKADIYMSTMGIDGRFQKAISIGPLINTPFNEERPFIHPNGKVLYFASDGHPGMGYKDLFVSRRNKEGQWQTPQNIGYPINTSRNEYGIFVTSDGQTAYISTKRSTEKQQDIYQFNLHKNIQPNPIHYIHGSVTSSTNTKGHAARIAVLKIPEETLFIESTSDSMKGTYSVALPTGTYRVQVVEKGYLPITRIITIDSSQQDITLDIFLQSTQVGSSYTMTYTEFKTSEFDLDYKDKADLVAVKKLLLLNPNIAIEIAGHTDDIGKASDNLSLSKKRAKAVYNWLLEEGIDKKRMIYNGYGSSQPIASNKTEEGRQRNRRTECVITRN